MQSKKCKSFEESIFRFPLACRTATPHNPRMRWRYLLPFLLLLVAGLVSYVLILTGEPGFEGKRLSDWLRDLRNPSFLIQSKAQLALRHIGSNVVPILRERLHAEDSPLKTNVINLLQRQKFVKIPFAPARERRIRAALACAVLGPAARPALPDIVEFSKDDAFCFNLAESALAQMGNSSVFSLCLLLTNADYNPRRLAIGALARMGPEAKEGISALTNCLNDRYPAIQANAIRALGTIAAPSPELLRSFALLCSDPDLEVRCCAEVALTGYGKSAMPSLSELLNDPAPEVRSAARKVLDEMNAPKNRKMD
jgi:HEAT repeat protein